MTPHWAQWSVTPANRMRDADEQAREQKRRAVQFVRESRPRRMMVPHCSQGLGAVERTAAVGGGGSAGRLRSARGGGRCGLGDVVMRHLEGRP